ncbi:MAG: alpha/beta hydrolase, partial [Cyanobacteria bacterium J06641_5]
MSTISPPRPLFYTWRGHRCAYEVYNPTESGVPLVLVHPIGVGLGRAFWRRFVNAWPGKNPIYVPDLLGCGQSDLPRAAYAPEDWARQLQYFIAEEVER